MKTPAVSLLILFVFSCASGSDVAWFLPRGCAGSNLLLQVSFDSTTILESRRPACKDYEDNRNGQWQKEMLTAVFEPDREITWTGYRDEPFNSPADSMLTIDLWLAGADVDQALWIIGVSVSDDDTIYMNTLHMADLTTDSETCIATDFCVKTWTN